MNELVCRVLSGCCAKYLLALVVVVVVMLLMSVASYFNGAFYFFFFSASSTTAHSQFALLNSVAFSSTSILAAPLVPLVISRASCF